METTDRSELAPRVRIQRRALHGVLLLDKPLGLSSNDALQKARWLMRALKGGHTGTLDPMATGVLPLCFGAATKFSQLHLDADKRYEALARLGAETTTGDAEGELIRRAPVQVTQEDVQRVTQTFLGPILQVPPMHSALKKDGRALYEYARAGIEIEREAREVSIHALSMTLQPEGETLAISVTCSKGTYIRTLAEDVGRALGCGAHLVALRRTATGDFGLSGCTTLADLERMDEAGRLACLQPVDCLLGGHVPIELAPADAGRFLSGLRRRGPWPDAARVAVYGTQPRALLGTAHVRAGELIPQRLLSPPEIAEILAADALP